ncbi:hypothetical protein COCNU_11G004290 [Cocos nucifera]|uniref:Uncharacterized protein n=1 Tax=Cocos nucifera TaxID=13894 RepID=A0A8K0IN97_COCNU|nr:hypothetical protein COCNU_11G004290 [Cocos nucifera]
MGEIRGGEWEAELKPMKDHIGFNSATQTKKPPPKDLKDIAGSPPLSSIRSSRCGRGSRSSRNTRVVARRLHPLCHCWKSSPGCPDNFATCIWRLPSMHSTDGLATPTHSSLLTLVGSPSMIPNSRGTSLGPLGMTTLLKVNLCSLASLSCSPSSRMPPLGHIVLRWPDPHQGRCCDPMWLHPGTR